MKKNTTLMAALLSVLMLTACGDTSSSSSDAQSKADATASQAAESTAESSSEEEKEPTYRSIKLMTYGDSITDGFWLEGGYRVFLCDKLEANGLSQYVDLVGSKKSGKCYDNEHEGYTGFSIDRISDSITGVRSGIKSLMPKRIEKFQPDVVTLMIGTNDILSHYELDTAGDRLEEVIDLAFEKMPEGSVMFLATIPDMDASDNTYIDKDTFTVEYMDECVANYNEQVKALVEKKQGEGKNIILADVHSAITKEDLYDGVHPNEEGYKKIADFWYNIIADYITE